MRIKRGETSVCVLAEGETREPGPHRVPQVQARPHGGGDLRRVQLHQEGVYRAGALPQRPHQHPVLQHTSARVVCGRRYAHHSASCMHFHEDISCSELIFHALYFFFTNLLFKFCCQSVEYNSCDDVTDLVRLGFGLRRLRVWVNDCCDCYCIAIKLKTTGVWTAAGTRHKNKRSGESS